MQLIENMFSIEQLKVIRGLQNFDKLSFTGSASLIMAGVDIQRPIGDLDFVTTDEPTYNIYKKIVEEILAKQKKPVEKTVKTVINKEDYSDIFKDLSEKVESIINAEIIKDIAVEKVFNTDELFEGATELDRYLTKKENEEEEEYESDYEGSREFFISKKNNHVKLTVDGIGVCIFYKDKDKESLIKPLTVYIDTTVMEGENTTYTRLETSFIDPAYSIEAKMGYLSNYHYMLAQEDMIWHGQVKRWQKHKEDILKYLQWFEEQITFNLEDFEDFKSSR